MSSEWRDDYIGSISNSNYISKKDKQKKNQMKWTFHIFIPRLLAKNKTITDFISLPIMSFGSRRWKVILATTGHEWHAAWWRGGVKGQRNKKIFLFSIMVVVGEFFFSEGKEKYFFERRKWKRTVISLRIVFFELGLVWIVIKFLTKMVTFPLTGWCWPRVCNDHLLFVTMPISKKSRLSFQHITSYHTWL